METGLVSVMPYTSSTLPLPMISSNAAWDSLGKGAGPGYAYLQAGEVEPPEFWIGHQYLVEGGHVGQDARLAASDFLADIIRVPGVWNQDLGPPHFYGADGHRGPGQVENGKRGEKDVLARFTAQPGGDAEYIGDDVPVAQHGALGITGGAARVLDPAQVVGGEGPFLHGGATLHNVLVEIQDDFTRQRRDGARWYFL